MKIPKKLKIGGHIFTVDCSTRLDNAVGLTKYDESKILLCNSLDKTHQEATLFHEIFHCINTVTCDDKVFHALIDSFSEQIYQVLKDNNLLK